MQTALSVRETVMKIMNLAVYICVYFISIIVLVFSTDWRLSVPLIIWLVVYVVILRALLPKLKAVSQKQADDRSIMTGRIIDSYTNISTVKLFSHANRESSYTREGMDQFLQTVHPQMRLVTKLQVIVWILNSLLIFSVGALSIYLWTENAVSIGAIAIAVGLNLRLNGMSQWIMWEVSMLFENVGTVQDGINTLSIDRHVQDQHKAPPLRVSTGRIEFDHVRFHYGKEHGLFEDLSVSIKAGEKIGLIGRSGAGKSSLVNLLLRFHDLESGRILIDDADISQVQQNSLREFIGVVTQDTSLLHRSVRDNILYGRPDASEVEMIRAAQQAHADEFIHDLSDAKNRTGYDAHVGERGVKLSGGQRQRIAIARVLLKNAPILVLDEATSALDTESEKLIQHALEELQKSRTNIVIAHRLSTIENADLILVIEKGEVVEHGTHRELLAKDGMYAQLHQMQFSQG